MVCSGKTSLLPGPSGILCNWSWPRKPWIQFKSPTFSSSLLINLRVSTPVRVGRVRLRKRAFWHWLIPPRKWQLTLLKWHRDHLGCGQGLCRQLVWILVAVEFGLNSSFGARMWLVRLHTYSENLWIRYMKESSGKVLVQLGTTKTFTPERLCLTYCCLHAGCLFQV